MSQAAWTIPTILDRFSVHTAHWSIACRVSGASQLCFPQSVVWSCANEGERNGSARDDPSKQSEQPEARRAQGERLLACARTIIASPHSRRLSVDQAYARRRTVLHTYVSPIKPQVAPISEQPTENTLSNFWNLSTSPTNDSNDLAEIVGEELMSTGPEILGSAVIDENSNSVVGHVAPVHNSKILTVLRKGSLEVSHLGHSLIMSTLDRQQC